MNEKIQQLKRAIDEVRSALSRSQFTVLSDIINELREDNFTAAIEILEDAERNGIFREFERFFVSDFWAAMENLWRKRMKERAKVDLQQDGHEVSFTVSAPDDCSFLMEIYYAIAESEVFHYLNGGKITLNRESRVSIPEGVNKVKLVVYPLVNNKPNTGIIIEKVLNIIPPAGHTLDAPALPTGGSRLLTPDEIESLLASGGSHLPGASDPHHPHAYTPPTPGAAATPAAQLQQQVDRITEVLIEKMAEVLAALIDNPPKIEKSGAEGGNVLVMLFTITHPFEGEIRMGIPKKDAQEATRVIMRMEVQPSEEVVLSACQEIARQTAGEVNANLPGYKTESKLDSEYKGAAPADALWRSINSIEDGETTTKVHIAAWASVPGIPAAAHAGNPAPQPPAAPPTPAISSSQQALVQAVNACWQQTGWDSGLVRQRLEEAGFGRLFPMNTSDNQTSESGGYINLIPSSGPPDWLLVASQDGPYLIPARNSAFEIHALQEWLRAAYDGTTVFPVPIAFEKLDRPCKVTGGDGKAGIYHIREKGQLRFKGVDYTSSASAPSNVPAQSIERLPELITEFWRSPNKNTKAFAEELRGNGVNNFRFAKSVNLNKSIQTREDYWFEGTNYAAEIEWLLVSDRSNIWAAPLKPDHFKSGRLSVLLRYTFDGCDSISEASKFDNLIKLCKLNTGNAEQGYKLISKGEIKLSEEAREPTASGTAHPTSSGSAAKSRELGINISGIWYVLTGEETNITISVNNGISPFKYNLSLTDSNGATTSSEGEFDENSFTNIFKFENPGKHKIQVTIKDRNGKQGTSETEFTVH